MLYPDSRTFVLFKKYGFSDTWAAILEFKGREGRKWRDLSMQRIWEGAGCPARRGGDIVDLAAFRRAREQAAQELWTGALLWDREPRRAPARAESRRSGAGERGAWALDIGASLTVAVMAVAFVMRAMTF